MLTAQDGSMTVVVAYLRPVRLPKLLSRRHGIPEKRITNLSNHRVGCSNGPRPMNSHRTTVLVLHYISIEG